MDYCWRSYMNGQSWSIQFWVLDIFSPNDTKGIQSEWILKIFWCTCFSSMNTSLNQCPICASTLDINMSDNICFWRAKGIHQFQCAWYFLSYNNIQVSAMSIRTTKINLSGLCPALPQLVSSSTKFYFLVLSSMYTSKLHTIYTVVYLFH
jgi:hypothetical protein